jgi:serine/threonine-protein kinase
VSTIDRRIGRYVLLDPVGRGAMGVVYRAEDPFIHRAVAVKVLQAIQGMTPQQIRIAHERFRRESQTAGSIDHPNIVRIFDVGEEVESGDMYIVMEYLEGEDLAVRLERVGRLDSRTTYRIVAQVARALMRAHDWSQSSLGPPKSWPQSTRCGLNRLS